MSDAPSVSVVLPSLDGERHLDEAVESVRAQTFKDWELLLVDDGSSDATGAKMDAWAARDPRIRTLHLSPNRGLPAALNEGFRQARGELFAWTSDDNVYLPDALDRLHEALERAPDADIAYADHLILEPTGGERRVHVPSTRLLPFQNVIGCCFLYRREVHEEIGGFDEDCFLAEDYDFWLRASTRFRFTAVHEVLYRYRVHGDSLTSQRAGDTYLAAARATDRFLPALSREERAHALLQRAEYLVERGQARAARIRVLRALLASPALALSGRFRRAVLVGLVGKRFTRLLGATFRRRGLPVRLVVSAHLGGVATYALNLAAARPADAAPLRLCRLEEPGAGRSPSPADESADPALDLVRVPHRWPEENLFAVLRRLHRASGDGDGPILTHDLHGLAYAARHGSRSAVLHVVHQDTAHYYELAECFEPFIDAFVAVSEQIRDTLQRRLPERAGDIHYVRSGVPIDARRRAAPHGPLRLVFSGRLEPVKGVLELPEIDRLLRERGSRVTWTVVGAGPLATRLREAFASEAEVHFTGALDYAEARARVAANDVLVLPSAAEGLSLALLEAMGAGLVPVASDIASGTREIVEPGVTGFLARPGEPLEFAAAIERLAADRALLERISKAAAARVEARHSLQAFGDAFFALLDDVARRPVPRRPAFTRGPSRLDRPWIPNAAVRGIKALRRSMR